MPPHSSSAPAPYRRMGKKANPKPGALRQAADHEERSGGRVLPAGERPASKTGSESHEPMREQLERRYELIRRG